MKNIQLPPNNPLAKILKANIKYFIVGVVIVISAVFLLFKNVYNPTPQPQPPMKEEPEVIEEIPEEAEKNEIILQYPTDKLIITTDRKNYSDGDLQLIIPALELDCPVLHSVDYEVLKLGVGLYEYSQLPSEAFNSNVSIAGHRDIYGCEFYSIDKLGDGDIFELVYNGKVYTYLYKDTQIVSDDDWSPIYSKDFSCLTLTSCHPIGTSLKRIIVTASLDKVTDTVNCTDSVAITQ